MRMTRKKKDAVEAEVIEEVVEEHVHDEKCEHGHQTVLSEKEVRNLVKSGYEKRMEDFDTAFLLMNKKTMKMVELRAASPVHACNFIGWRPRHVKLLSQRSVSEEAPKEEVKKPEEVKA